MQRPVSFRARRLALSAGVALLLPPAAQAVAYLPGAQAEPDPPTGDVATPERPADGGIRWVLAPWRREGALTAEWRQLRLGDGGRSMQRLAFADLDFASHVWEPWFVQLRAGLGLLASRTSGEQQVAGGDSGGVTGRLAVAVFPASRFPFELRADVADSRTGGDTLAGDFRTTRLSLSQSWRPEDGNDHLSLHVDRSRLSSDAFGSDTLDAVSLLATRQLAEHSFDLDAAWSHNRRSNSGDESRLASLSARHGFHPSAHVLVDTLASRNEVVLDTAGLRSGSRVTQLSSVATWRPVEGEPLYAAERPLTLGGSARWVQAEDLNGEAGVRALSANVGAGMDLGSDWRLTASAAGGRVDNASGGSESSAGANLAAVYTPAPLSFGDWRWGPSASGSLGVDRSSRDGRRHLEGLQAVQTLSRDWPRGEQAALSLSLSQSAGVLAESSLGQTTRSLAHGVSLFWQSTGEGGRQSFVGLSASDARNWADVAGSFQLVNLQWTQREPFGRWLSAAANLTFQATRNNATLTDVFTGERRSEGGGWLRYYTASVNVEHQRAFGVPRLRWSLYAAANSQQLEQRAFGDLEAPRELVTASIETRLDYAIGRLETRLSARVARIDERTVAALQARVTRRF